MIQELQSVEDKWGDIANRIGNIQVLCKATLAHVSIVETKEEIQGLKDGMGEISDLFEENILPQIEKLYQEHDELEKLIWQLENPLTELRHLKGKGFAWNE